MSADVERRLWAEIDRHIDAALARGATAVPELIAHRISARIIAGLELPDGEQGECLAYVCRQRMLTQVRRRLAARALAAPEPVDDAPPVPADPAALRACAVALLEHIDELLRLMRERRRH